MFAMAVLLGSAVGNVSLGVSGGGSRGRRGGSCILTLLSVRCRRQWGESDAAGVGGRE